MMDIKAETNSEDSIVNFAIFKKQTINNEFEIAFNFSSFYCIGSFGANIR